MTRVSSHRVRYHEADAQGFLFNARYLEIADVAMVEFFRRLGFSYPDMVANGMDPSVVSADLTFAKPARFDDLLDVEVTCTHVGTSSFGLTTAIARDDVRLAQLRLVYVNVDALSATSRAIPMEVAAVLLHAKDGPA